MERSNYHIVGDVVSYKGGSESEREGTVMTSPRAVQRCFFFLLGAVETKTLGLKQTLLSPLLCPSKTWLYIFNPKGAIDQKATLG